MAARPQAWRILQRPAAPPTSRRMRTRPADPRGSAMRRRSWKNAGVDGDARYTQHYCLPDVDEGFAAGVAAEDLPLLRRVLTVPGETVEPGPWAPGPHEEAGAGAFAVVVLDGLLAADVLMAERASTMLLGPGDVL